VIEWFVPPKFRPLLRPARYKGAKGGRGSGKSHFFAGHGVIRMMEGKNLLCVREVQNTIADSVKRLLEGKIEEFGWGPAFDVTEREIRCKETGAVCIFRGMQNHTAASVKSLEGFDIAWWEEAQTASQRSLDLLTPTIRTPGSELWFSWNPEDESDPIEKLLVAEPPEGAIVVTANWSDNPRFPEELRADMERDLRRDPDKHAHVWEGAYRSASETRIFRNFRTGDVETPENAVWFYGVDFGYSVDPLAGVRFCFPDAGTIYISHEVYEVGVAQERVPVVLAEGLPGIMKWPVAADSARPDTIDFCRRHGIPRMGPAIKGPGSVEDGTTFLQGFDIIISPRCPSTLREFQRYAYKADRKTGEILPVAEDAWNHAIDALRYGAERAHRKGKLVPGVVKTKREPADYGLGGDDDTDSWRAA
jgi:phage terminase large subunit